MSKTRASSLSSAAASVYCGERQSMDKRVGASRLPSRRGAGVSLTEWFSTRAPPEPLGPGQSTTPWLTKPSGLLAERVESLLEAVRVRALRLRERLEPIRDLLETLGARG